MSEIELKFVTGAHAQHRFSERVLPLFDKHQVTVISHKEMRLENDYYDTEKFDFQQKKMGFRVRGNNGHYEQTLKTNGVVSGGLHTRSEYNVDLQNPTPDLSLFDASVWPQNWDVASKNASLARQFSTHFIRHAYDVEVNGSRV